MDDDVPAAIKAARRDRIMRLQKQIAAARQKSRIGQTLPVMVDGPSPESPLVVTGRLAGQAPDIDSQVYFSDCDPSAVRPGTIVPSRILAARGYDLVATPLLG
jgi:ribosomal protein S12 methylthiotransferase